MQLKHLIYEYRLARETYQVDYMEKITAQIAKYIENYPLFIQRIIWRKTFKRPKELVRMGLLRKLLR